MKIKISKKITVVYTFAVIVIGIIFFQILPKILNYPPDSINNTFQRGVDIGLLYNEQYSLIILICYIIGLIAIKLRTKNIDNIEYSIFQEFNSNNLKIVTSMFNLPYQIYLIHLIIPTIAIIGIYALSEGAINMGTIKIALVIVTIETLIALVEFVFCKNLVSKLFSKLYINKKYIKKFVSLKGKIFIIILPMILVALVFTSLLGYSQIVDEKGEYMYISNKILLENNIDKSSYTLEEINKNLNNIQLLEENDDKFIVFSDGKFISYNDQKLSEFFIKYTLKQSEEHEGRTYETYGIDRQGAVKKVEIDGKDAYVGIAFDITSNNTLIHLGLSITLLFFINCFVLYYVSKSLADDTKRVANALNGIVNNKSKKHGNVLPITSNDEIAELVIAFNEIQNLTEKHIQEIENNQYVMERQAQFSALGEFAAGLAHDLNSPLSAVKMDIGTLKMYINSNKVSADDNTMDKLNEMFQNISESLESMSATVIGVRNQIRTTGDTENEKFLLIQVVEGIKILFRSLFMKNNCQLIIDIPSDLEIYGEKNKLDRVIGNLIKNSLDAYMANNIKGDIKVKAYNKNDKIVISVSDNAGGISDNVKDKIFKEMKTTKKDSGTGFGLYYSNMIY